MTSSSDTNPVVDNYSSKRKLLTSTKLPIKQNDDRKISRASDETAYAKTDNSTRERDRLKPTIPTPVLRTRAVEVISSSHQKSRATSVDEVEPITDE